ncbi:ABC transporter permease/substrate-binding protein [Dellaglioa algida]|uniref:ABC transporter permease/substrate-binding protein n=1 Tax=Dellaglioa algida TaxID=105612 RepID=UPI000BC8E5C2|nr:ABC transporter permease/substrate-binding protein [Dellaglioa algida]MDK1717977.1 ABC transporter permease/substrate-binding protein [Dellaglioa algida]MDK1729831.1 ABC transporter permease/substrate-binding protein [Dellaglioa algida]MDK1742265.1 ABC transporter permease/substrate-binding protein [Dellaglioa algida]SOB49158.1 Glycine betaine/carnitine/choline ABC transporter, substrate binding and permease protein [Dellaglioa algida]
MTQLMETFQTHRSDLWTAILQHLQISLISLLIATVIAVSLAIWLVQYKRAAEIVLQITSILQTIPSLALLGLLIPLVGIGTLPSIIALVAYALLPIFQNTYVGLTSIDPSLEEAATAFGMTRTQKLIRFELPLAMPLIISGIRIAFVLIIGTATLAALIGAGGLGTFILLGIDRNDMSLIIIGALSSIILAVLFSALIRRFQNLKVKTIAIILIVLGVLFAGGATINTLTHQKKELVIAGKMGAEPEILINMYKDLIEHDDPTINVTLKPNFGKTSFLYSALKSKSIDIYPEFSGTVLEELVKTPLKNTNKEQVYQQAKSAIKAKDNLDFLDPMAYQNTYAIAVTKEFADQYHLTKISDLSRVSSKIKAGFTLEFLNRGDGYKGIEKKYGVSFNAKSFEPSLRYQAIANGDVNLIDAYSTDSQLIKYNLVMLRDDQHLFPPYQGAPLIAKGILKKYPTVKKSLNKLGHKISDTDMQEMNYLVDVKNVPASKVAHDYLTKHHLLD